VKSGATPITKGSVTSGQSVKVSALYDAPTTQSNLAVSVSGTFGGKSQTKVQSFTINSGAPAKPASEPAVDSGGRKVKVMKAP
jgi:hypothetical protein